MYLIDSPWFCWVSERFWMDLVEAKEEDEEEEKKEKEKEKEDNKIGVAEKSFHYCHACCRFVIAILGLAKGVPFVDLLFLLFLIRVLQGNQLFGNWIRFPESKLLLIKSDGCFEKDLLYLTLLAILKVNRANWLLVLEKKLELGKKFPLLPCWVHYWPCPLGKVWTWLFWQY